MAKFYTLNANSDVALEGDVDSAKTELNARIDLIEATSHPNMNIVGSPTFYQGTVSGFSANDYLVFPTQVDVGANEVDFYLAFTTGANVTAQQNILDSWCGLAFAIQNGGTVTAASYNGTEFITSAEAGVVVANSAYRAKFSFRKIGENYTVTTYLANGAGEYQQVGQPIVMPAPLHATATYWGGANPSSGVPHIYGGSINLAECRMDWNGKTVWRGYDELPTVKFDPTAENPLDTAEKIAAFGQYPIVATTTGALLDRTVNTAATGMAFTFPAGGTGARDFVVVVAASATAPSVSFPSSGVSYFSDDDAVWTAEVDKVNVWYFTEIAANQFMVAHKALNETTQA